EVPALALRVWGVRSRTMVVGIGEEVTDFAADSRSKDEENIVVAVQGLTSRLTGRQGRLTMYRIGPRITACYWLLPASGLFAVLAGCHTIPLAGKIDTDARVAAGFNGTVDVRLPAATDPGPMVPVIVRHGAGGPQSLRVAVVDVDGILVNQNLAGLFA